MCILGIDYIQYIYIGFSATIICILMLNIVCIGVAIIGVFAGATMKLNQPNKLNKNVDLRVKKVLNFI